MKRYMIITNALLAILLVGCTSVTSGGGQVMDGDGMIRSFDYTQISQDEAKRMMDEEDDYVIVDVRREDEYAQGHIPGAILIPNESIGEYEAPEELTDSDQIILVYCRSGRRSKEAAEKLARMGFSRVYEFGGIIDWDGEIEGNAPEVVAKEEEKAMNTENIEVFTQNSIRITTSTGILYVDPFRMKEEPHNADFVLITHDHYDHYSPEDIAKVSKDDTVIIVPGSMEKKVANEVSKLVKRIETMEPDEHKDVDGLSIDTVPAYNNSKNFHPRGSGWVGYILDIDGMRVYIAGDTDKTEDNMKVGCDVALVPIGGTYTMDAKEAAELINSIKPKVAIPTHYGSIVGKDSDAEVFSGLVDDNIKVEVKKQYQ